MGIPRTASRVPFVLGGNSRNQVVATVGEFLYRITEPLLRPIRSMLPNLGGIDVSPVILILLILFIENVIVRYIYPNVF